MQCLFLSILQKFFKLIYLIKSRIKVLHALNGFKHSVRGIRYGLICIIYQCKLVKLIPLVDKNIFLDKIHLSLQEEKVEDSLFCMVGRMKKHTHNFLAQTLVFEQKKRFRTKNCVWLVSRMLPFPLCQQCEKKLLVKI